MLKKLFAVLLVLAILPGGAFACAAVYTGSGRAADGSAYRISNVDPEGGIVLPYTNPAGEKTGHARRDGIFQQEPISRHRSIETHIFRISGQIGTGTVEWISMADNRTSVFVPCLPMAAEKCCRAALALLSEFGRQDRRTDRRKREAVSVWKCPKCGREFARQNQDHYCAKPESIDAYIAMQDEAVQPRLREVRGILRAALPEAEERMSWSMPTYWKGRNIIHFAASKKHLGLYPGGEATTVFAEELRDFDVSKGTIRIPWDRGLPAALIERIAGWCYEEYSK